MNERIEKLIEQCTVQNFSDCTGGFETFDKQKFAQLIVKECADIAKDTQDFYDEHNDSQVNTEIWTMIKLHFGVEE